MKVYLLENQIELLMKSLENYAPNNRDKQQLIYATYESLQEQLTSKKIPKINVFEGQEKKLNFF